MSKQPTITKQEAWLKAMRLRTLPLAIASILMGGFLATEYDSLRMDVVILAVLTTVFLQILSNLANDYGDAVNGADSQDRVGPKRMVQSGIITKKEMLRAMGATAVLSMLTGLLLVIISVGLSRLPLVIGFLALGALAVWAAVRYTAGDNPYGYAGLGDIFVFLFFGPIAVLGTFFLQSLTIEWATILPTISCGLLSVAVLNVNNIRDIESDEKAGKHSIPVRIGQANAYKYHWFLLLGAIVTAVTYILIQGADPVRWLTLLIVPFILKSGYEVSTKPLNQLDPLLKMTSMVTLGFVLLFGLGQIFA